MDEFVKKAFEEAIENDEEAEKASQAWRDNAESAFLVAKHLVGDDRFEQMSRAICVSGSEDAFYRTMMVMFFSGLSCRPKVFPE